MNDRAYTWVTVARCWSTGEALFFKSVLEGNDIPAFVRDEFIGQLMSHFTLSRAEGGVQLQVPSDCVEAALEILEGAHADEILSDEGDNDEPQ